MTILDLTSVPISDDDPKSREEIKSITSYRKQNPVKMYYLDEINDVYYLSLEDFASIFEGNYASGLSFTVSEDGPISTWSINRFKTPEYILTLDALNKTMTVEGASLSAYIISTTATGYSGMGQNMTASYEFVEEHPNTNRVYSLGDYDFDVFEADGHYRYPFALLLAEVSKSTDRSFLTLSATSELLEYGSQEQLDRASFLLEDGTKITANDYINKAYASQYGTGVPGEDPVEPEALRVFNRNLFYFIMDNYYGISMERGISSMRDYFESFADSANFLSENGTKRGNAYFRLVQMLNDLHTAYSYSPYFGEKGDSEGIYSQTMYRIRMDLYTFLTDMRQSAIDEYNLLHETELSETGVRYSSDGKYAYFSFDKFKTYTVYNTGFIPRNVQLEDTYNLFVENLNEAKRRGVERVIIDDSCNSGGYIGIMAELLALLSKDNYGVLYVQGGDNGSIQKMTVRVDSNKDGVYDESDCFGNDFEFYIVTSNFSFSCGNAFPVLAASYGYAKIVGQKSGGGECCVYTFRFPSGQVLTYSSPYHLGFYGDDGTFRGAEVGTFVQYGIGDGFHDLYDVDAVASRIETIDEGGFGPFPI